MLTPIHELELDQMVEVKVGHAPYQVIAIDDNFITFIGKDGLFSDTSGFAMVLNTEPVLQMFKNNRGVIHAQIGDKTLCGHRSIGISMQVEDLATCQHCVRLLEGQESD